MDEPVEPRFKRGGTGHRVLTALSSGPKSMGQIKDQCASLDPDEAKSKQRRRRKVWYAVQECCHLGWASPEGASYVITVEGLHELGLLGPLVVRTPNPNIRTFSPEKETA
jgi:hypothetical protein